MSIRQDGAQATNNNIQDLQDDVVKPSRSPHKQQQGQLTMLNLASVSSGTDAFQEAHVDVDEGLQNIYDAVIDEHILRRLTGKQDLSAVESLRIRLDLNLQNTMDLTDHLPALTALVLDGSVIDSVRDLGTTLSKLMSLSINKCNLSDLDGIGVLTHLQDLSCSENRIFDVSGMALHESIVAIDLTGNKLASLSFTEDLDSCPRLSTLVLSKNLVTKCPQYREVVGLLLPAVTTLDNTVLQRTKGISSTRKDELISAAASALAQLEQDQQEEEQARAERMAAETAALGRGGGDGAGGAGGGATSSSSSRAGGAGNNGADSMARHVGSSGNISMLGSSPRASVSSSSSSNNNSNSRDKDRDSTGVPDTGSELTHGSTVVLAGNMAAAMRRRNKTATSAATLAVAAADDSDRMDTLRFLGEGDITNIMLPEPEQALSPDAHGYAHTHRQGGQRREENGNGSSVSSIMNMNRSSASVSNSNNNSNRTSAASSREGLPESSVRSSASGKWSGGTGKLVGDSFDPETIHVVNPNQMTVTHISSSSLNCRSSEGWLSARSSSERDRDSMPSVRPGGNNSGNGVYSSSTAPGRSGGASGISSNINHGNTFHFPAPAPAPHPTGDIVSSRTSSGSSSHTRSSSDAAQRARNHERQVTMRGAPEAPFKVAADVTDLEALPFHNHSHIGGKSAAAAGLDVRREPVWATERVNTGHRGDNSSTKLTEGNGFEYHNDTAEAANADVVDMRSRATIEAEKLRFGNKSSYIHADMVVRTSHQEDSDDGSDGDVGHGDNPDQIQRSRGGHNRDHSSGAQWDEGISTSTAARLKLMERNSSSRAGSRTVSLNANITTLASRQMEQQAQQQAGAQALVRGAKHANAKPLPIASTPPTKLPSATSAQKDKQGGGGSANEAGNAAGGVFPAKGVAAMVGASLGFNLKESLAAIDTWVGEMEESSSDCDSDGSLDYRMDGAESGSEDENGEENAAHASAATPASARVLITSYADFSPSKHGTPDIGSSSSSSSNNNNGNNEANRLHLQSPNSPFGGAATASPGSPMRNAHAGANDDEHAPPLHALTHEQGHGQNDVREHDTVDNDNNKLSPLLNVKREAHANAATRTRRHSSSRPQSGSSSRTGSAGSSRSGAEYTSSYAGSTTNSTTSSTHPAILTRDVIFNMCSGGENLNSSGAGGTASSTTSGSGSGGNSEREQLAQQSSLRAERERAASAYLRDTSKSSRGGSGIASGGGSGGSNGNKLYSSDSRTLNPLPSHAATSCSPYAHGSSSSKSGDAAAGVATTGGSAIQVANNDAASSNNTTNGSSTTNTSNSNLINSSGSSGSGAASHTLSSPPRTDEDVPVAQLPGLACTMADTDLIAMLQRPPKVVPQLRTKSGYVDFFRGISADRMQKLLESAYAELEGHDRKEKVKKRMQLLSEILQ